MCRSGREYTKNKQEQEDLRMYGYIAGVTDAGEINYCPYCGEEIIMMHAGGTATCGSCKRRFGVVEIDDEE
jgi:DNA-directed RNA polymerase subunit RPC12/RpoP